MLIYSQTAALLVDIIMNAYVLSTKMKTILLFGLSLTKNCIDQRPPLHVFIQLHLLVDGFVEDINVLANYHLHHQELVL